MKKKDVPQDKSNLASANFKELCYAVDENGEYTTGLSTGWDPKNAALEHARDFYNERAEKVKEKVQKGKLSPLAYFMETRYMDASLLADYMELSKRVVKRHMTPKYFNELDDEVLKEYAEILRIEFNELKDFPLS
jgi:hypothetical protein